MSRPQPFGKSLILSTFEAFFSGPPDPDGPHQGLFKDLWIGRHSDYDFTRKHPILNLVMSITAYTKESLLENISDILKNIVNNENLNIFLSLSSIKFSLIIKNYLKSAIKKWRS